MRIALVAPSSVPFVVGGAEKLWWGLQQHINRHTDHPCELIKLPAAEGSLPELVASYRRFAALDLAHFDRVFTTKYPAWIVSHPYHVVYLQHRLRGLYDTYPWPDRVAASTASPWLAEAWPDHGAREWLAPALRAPAVRELRRLLESAPQRSRLDELFAAFFDVAARETADASTLLAFPGPLARAIVHWLDAVALAPGAIRRYLAISRTVAHRDGYFPPDAKVQVQPHPSNLEFPARTRATVPGRPVFFTASRLDGPKRLDLLIQAFAQVAGDIELRIAGTGPEHARLAALVATDPRVRLMGFLRDDEIVGQYYQALAVPFLPYAEDMGLITLEAMRAGRPVITCTDSGGPTEWVRNGETGWVVPPAPKALADAMRAAMAHPRRTRAMGRLGRMRTRGVTWAAVVRALLENAADDATTLGHFPPRFLVLNTFSCYPPRGGGQQRCFHLYRHLAAASGGHVTMLVLDPAAAVGRSRTLAPGFDEHIVPMGAGARERLRVLSERVGAPIADLFAMQAWRDEPAFIEALQEMLTPETIGIAAHPYLAEALQRYHRGPWWYDAYNVELHLKREILAPALIEGGADVRDWVRGTFEQLAQVEAMACRASRWVSACSQADWDRFREQYALPVDKGVVVPNCADISGTAFVDIRRRREWQRRLSRVKPLALFVGSWHGPNLDAAEWLISNLSPQRPEVDFLLVGSLCDGLAGETLPANVRFAGVVSESMLQVLMSSADVGLNPVTTGSGSNLKVLEYAAAGLPVLTTPFGRRGIALSDAECWVAERERYAEALGRLLHCPEARLDDVVTQARRRIEREHDWGHAARLMLRHAAQEKR